MWVHMEGFVDVAQIALNKSVNSTQQIGRLHIERD